MGCFSSCLKKKDYSDYEQRLSILDINERSDSDSDSSLKARAEIASENRISNLLGSKTANNGDKEKIPLLEGSLRNLDDLNLSNSSSSVDMEMEKLNNYLQPKNEQIEEEEEAESSARENDTGRTFPGTKVNLNDVHSSDLND